MPAQVDPVDRFQPTAEEQERLALMSRPEAWFLQNLRGPREFIDGQLLDPKLQYHLEDRRLRYDAVRRRRELFHSAEGRVVARRAHAREWALLTKVSAPMRTVEDREITGPRGQIAVRIYTPYTKEQGALPVMLYFHGGGWIYGDIEAVDRCARLIANEAQLIVISVDYGLAPENPWPAGIDDGVAAFRWTLANAASLGGDPELVGVAGDSAGGNIALSISLRQIRAGQPTPLCQMPYYAAASFSPKYESARLFGEGYGLDREFRELMVPLVYGSADKAEVAVSDLREANLQHMPATIVATAGFDMLRDAGRSFARRLEDAGVAVTYLNYPTLIHGFLQWSAVVADAERAAVDTARLFGTVIRSRPPMARRRAGEGRAT